MEYLCAVPACAFLFAPASFLVVGCVLCRAPFFSRQGYVFPCAMEFLWAFTGLAFFFGSCSFLVGGCVLCRAPFFSRHGYVFPGAPLDGKPLCGGGGRRGVCL